MPTNNPSIADIDAAIAAQSGPSMADIDKAIAAQSGNSEGPESPGLIARAAKALNSVTVEPVEAGIYAAQSGKNPLKAYGHQFANQTDSAPSGRDIALKAGLSDDNSDRNIYMNNPQGGAPILQPDLKGRSNADIGGFAVDQVANPLNYAGPAFKLAGKVIEPVANAASGALKGFAEDAAVNATGATGKQASTFAPGAGRELLDRGIVKFGSNQKQIAQRAAEAVDHANQQIDASLAHLQKQGVTVDSNTVYNTVRNTISKMRGDPSKADIANHLENELNNIIKSSDATGSSEVPIQDAEITKRGYGRKAGNWADPEASQAGKTMYQTYRGAVENAAQAADPATAQTFIDAKQTHGLMSPIEEAAARRAATTGQHQAGGFLDVASSLAGEAAGGPIAAIGVPLARRMIMPRVASSIAVGADEAGNLLQQAPKVISNTPAPVASFINQNLAPESLAMPNAASNSPQQSEPIQKRGPATMPTPIQQVPQVIPPPKGGTDKWAMDGFHNLRGHVDDADRKLLDENKGKILLDPKMKNLLVTASNYDAGSKPLDDILKHLKNGLGEK